jgi:hypothetical protein
MAPLPKGGLLPISQGNSRGGIEEIHIRVIARVAKAHPNLRQLFPFLPRPSQPKCSSEVPAIKDTKASKVFRSTNNFPINLALAAGNIVGARP